MQRSAAPTQHLTAAPAAGIAVTQSPALGVPPPAAPPPDVAPVEPLYLVERGDGTQELTTRVGEVAAAVQEQLRDAAAAAETPTAASLSAAVAAVDEVKTQVKDAKAIDVTAVMRLLLSYEEDIILIKAVREVKQTGPCGHLALRRVFFPNTPLPKDDEGKQSRKNGPICHLIVTCTKAMKSCAEGAAVSDQDQYAAVLELTGSPVAAALFGDAPVPAPGAASASQSGAAREWVTANEYARLCHSVFDPENRADLDRMMDGETRETQDDRTKKNGWDTVAEKFNSPDVSYVHVKPVGDDLVAGLDPNDHSHKRDGVWLGKKFAALKTPYTELKAAMTQSGTYDSGSEQVVRPIHDFFGPMNIQLSLQAPLAYYHYMVQQDPGAAEFGSRLIHGLASRESGAANPPGRPKTNGKRDWAMLQMDEEGLARVMSHRSLELRQHDAASLAVEQRKAAAAEQQAGSAIMIGMLAHRQSLRSEEELMLQALIRKHAGLPAAAPPVAAAAATPAASPAQEDEDLL